MLEFGICFLYLFWVFWSVILFLPPLIKRAADGEVDEWLKSVVC